MATCNHLDIARLWKKYGVEPQQGDLSSMLKTDGDAVTPWRPQSFRAVTLESQRWTEDSATVNNQGDVRIREPRDPMLRFSSRLLLVRDALLWHVIAWAGWEFRCDHEDYHMFCMCYSTAMWNSLDVPAQLFRHFLSWSRCRRFQ